MLPEYDHDDRVEAVKCLACGNRLWRQFTRRTASELERDTRCGRPAHQRI